MKGYLRDRRYDIKAAEVIAFWEDGFSRSRRGAYEMLMVTPEGDYFLAARGGAHAAYSGSLRSGRDGEYHIHPLSSEDALNWFTHRGRTDGLSRFLIDREEQDGWDEWDPRP